jgi:hypothetical protein
MMEAKENRKFEKVAQRIDPQSRLLHTWKLKGGVSAHNYLDQSGEIFSLRATHCS